MRFFKSSIFLLVVMLLGINRINAEIQEVSLTWTAGLCHAQCIKNLEMQFRRIPSVQEVQINEGAGKATLKLKKNMPYSFAPFNQAMELVGLSIIDIRVIATGQISNVGQDFVLISTGDNTTFTLINPIIPERSGYVVQYNAGAVNRKLSPAMVQQMEDAKKSKQIATIQGPLFFPERSPPNLLVIEQIRFNNPGQQGTQ